MADHFLTHFMVIDHFIVGRLLLAGEVDEAALRDQGVRILSKEVWWVELELRGRRELGDFRLDETVADRHGNVLKAKYLDGCHIEGDLLRMRPAKPIPDPYRVARIILEMPGGSHMVLDDIPPASAPHAGYLAFIIDGYIDGGCGAQPWKHLAAAGTALPIPEP